MTASTPDELIAGFPYSSLLKVTGGPTFEDLKVIRRLLNTNAMSVSSYVGGGRHGHLGIIMTNEEYFAIAADVFPAPNNPWASAEVVVGMTAAEITEMTRLHREATQVFLTYHNVDQAIKKMILEAFDDAYLNDLPDEVVGYANCTSLDLLTHLLTFYAMIAPTELTQNYECLKTPYNPNQPTKTLFQQIKDARAFAVAGGQPYGNAMIINVAYTLVFNMGLFPDACRAWQSRSIAGKTWAQFKIDFATEHREFRLTNQTAHQSGFHSANMMIEQSRPESMNETAEAITQLATVTASDRSTVATLTTANAKLASQLEADNALIAQLNNEIATLKSKIKPAWQGQRPMRATNNDSYCWSHGHQVAKSHTSATCNMKKSGHQDAAIKSNTMGGVQWGKE
jgi:6-pyruvoyl-tetrahydropterin synthase